MSTDIATTGETNLPAMYNQGPESQLSARDIILPRIELVQGSSQLAKDGVADEGDIVFRYGSEDENPTWLVGGDSGADSFIGYVIARTKFVATTRNGFIEYQDERDLDDRDSWEGWDFQMCVPSVDPYLPARWRLWRPAGQQAAKAINTLFFRKEMAKDFSPLAIKAHTTTRNNKKGQSYKVASIGPATPDPDDLRIASEMRDRLFAILHAAADENEGPRVSAPTVEQPPIS